MPDFATDLDKKKEKEKRNKNWTVEQTKRCDVFSVETYQYSAQCVFQTQTWWKISKSVGEFQTKRGTQ